MAVTRHTSNFRNRTDIITNITPKTVDNMDVRASVGHYRPAPWLPVQFTKTDSFSGTDAFVCSKGKVVALDSVGDVVPAGMLLQLQSGAGALTYTSTDVDWGVIDLTTGETVAAAASYSSIEVAQALIERGLVLEQDAVDAGATVPASTQGHADDIIGVFISPPVGFAPYDYHVWSGRPEDGDQVFTNYSKQSGVAFHTESVLGVPHLVAGSEAADAWVVATVDGLGSTAAAAGEAVGAGEYWNATNLAALTRYSLMGITASSPVVALGLDPDGDGTEYVIARETSRTPLSVDTDGVLVRARTSPDKISQEGDYYLDAEVGVLILHSDTWATGVGGTATWTFSYNYYDLAPADAHKFVHFDGPAHTGRRVTFDIQSNFVEATEGTTAERDIVGQIHRVKVQPVPLLDSVKTGFGTSTNATFQMPGSATNGYTSAITLSDETVADQIVQLKFRI